MSNYTSYDVAKNNKINIISDEFDSYTGEWNNLLSYDASQTGQLKNQKHTDIRSFYVPKSLPSYVLYLNNKTVNSSSLQGVQVQNLKGQIDVIKSENWLVSGPSGSAVSVGVQSSYSNWYGLTLTCPVGQTIATSTLSDNLPIILTAYNPETDFITISIPSGVTNITLATSSIAFSKTNSFATSSDYDEIFFNDPDIQFIGSGTAKELRIPLFKLVNSIGGIVSVRFKIVAVSATVTFKCLSIRCISDNWVYAPVDINTQWGLVASTPSLNGSALSGTANTDYPNWPINSNSSYLPTVWPALYKSYSDSITTGSKPLFNDGEMEVWFNSGTLSAATNSISTHFRLGNQKSQQNDLNLKTQSALENLQTLDAINSTVSDYLQKDISRIPGKLANNYSAGPTSTLSGDISDTATSITVADASGFPTGGGLLAIQYTYNDQTTIEYIRYLSRSGNVFTVYSGGRGYLDTLATNHIAGARVDFEPLSITTAIGDTYTFSSTPTKLNGAITSSATSITLTNSSNFPSSGVILIDQEYIAYSANNTTTNTLTVSSRGYFSTLAAPHNNDTNVYFYTQSNASNYTNAVGSAQSQLNGRSQNDIENYINLNKISYVTFSIEWNSEGSTLKIKDESNIDLYSFALTNKLKTNTDYIFVPSVEGTFLRVQCFEIYNTSVGDPNHMIKIFDSGLIHDLLIHNNKGTVGWSASLTNGDAHIKSIRSRKLIYAEMRTSPINSYTPVKGTQIFVESNNAIQLLSNITTSPFNIGTSKQEIDQKKNNSNQCRRITNDSGSWQGVMTNQFEIEDFTDFSIKFNIFTTLNQKISAMLYNSAKNIVIPVYVPDFNNNQWQEVNLILDGKNHPTGNYSLIIAEESSQVGSVWWIDKLSITKNQIAWYARSFVNGVNQIGADKWVPINDVINSNKNGATFATAGNELQIKALAKTPFVELSKISVAPKYATLGNFIVR